MAGVLRVAHLGDIHIRKDRVREYAEVFAALRASLEAQRPDIIVVAGDVFHNMTYAYKEEMFEVANLLTLLAAVAPVVMIPGNHDTNCNQPGTLDMLTAALNGFDGVTRARITYLRHAGVQEAHGVAWVALPADEPVPPAEEIAPRLAELKEATPRICIFHKELIGVRYPNGTVIGGEGRDGPMSLRLEDLDPYDAAMGGHIHTRYDITPKVSYCGSLMQQSLSESHTGHGYVLWELKGREVTARTPVDIPAVRGFVRYVLRAGVDATAAPLPREVLRYEVEWDAATSREVANARVRELTAEHGKPPVGTISPQLAAQQQNLPGSTEEDSEEKEAEGQTMELAHEAVQQFATHERIVRDLLTTQESHVVDAVVEMHRARFSATLEGAPARAPVRLLRLEFDNMYCYGEGNVVDFTKMEGTLSGVIAPNHSGKSVLIDTLMYALYDVCPRGASKRDVANRDAAAYRVHLDFEVEGKVGFIEKQGRTTSNEAQKTRLNYGGVEVTEHKKLDTIKEIAKLVGNYEDAALTAIMHQKPEIDFVRATAAQRKTLAARLLSLGSFEAVVKAVKKERTALAAVQARLEKGATEGTLERLTDELHAAREEKEEADARLEALDAETKALASRQALLIRDVSVLARKAEAIAAKLPNAAALDERAEGRLEDALKAAGIADAEAAAAELVALPAAVPPSGDVKETPTAPAALAVLARLARAREVEEKVMQETAAALQVLSAEKAAAGAVAASLRKQGATDAASPAGERPSPTTPWPREKEGARPESAAVEAARALLGSLENPSWETVTQRINAEAVPSSAHELKDAQIAAAKAIAGLASYPPEVVEKVRALPVGKVATIGAAKFEPGEMAVEVAGVRVVVAQLRARVAPVEGCAGCAEMVKQLANENVPTLAAEIKKRQERGVAVGACRALAELRAAEKAEAEIEQRAEAAKAAAARERARWQEVAAAHETLEFAAYAWRRDTAAWAAHDAAAATRAEQELQTAAAETAGRAMAEAERKREAARATLAKHQTLADKVVGARKRALQLIAGLQEKVRSRELLEELTELSQRAAAARAELDEVKAALAVAQAEQQRYTKTSAASGAAAARLEERVRAEDARVSELAAGVRQLEVFAAYLLVLSPVKGIGDVLLDRVRAALELEINRALVTMRAGLVAILAEDYTLSFRDKGETVKAPIGAGLLSGQQEFELMIAARMALARLARVPFPDCLIIDEGFGTLDDANREEVADHLAAAARLWPDAPRLHFIVTHVEGVKSRMENPLSIEFVDGASRVNNTLDAPRVAPTASVAVAPRAVVPVKTPAKAVAAPAKVLQKAKAKMPVKAPAAAPAKAAHANGTAKASAAPSPPRAQEDEPEAKKETVVALPRDPKKLGYVRCETCGQSVQEGRAARHLASAKHKAKIV